MSVTIGMRGWGVAAVQGLGLLANTPIRSPQPPGFHFYRGMRERDFLNRPTSHGFYAGEFSGIKNSWAIVFPLWLATLLLAGLSWFAWRKTRGAGVGRGFPVEPTAAKTQGADDPTRGL